MNLTATGDATYNAYLPTLFQGINYSIWFESVFNFEFQPKLGIQLGIPILMGINLGYCIVLQLLAFCESCTCCMFSFLSPISRYVSFSWHSIQTKISWKSGCQDLMWSVSLQFKLKVSVCTFTTQNCIDIIIWKTSTPLPIQADGLPLQWQQRKAKLWNSV